MIIYIENQRKTRIIRCNNIFIKDENRDHYKCGCLPYPFRIMTDNNIVLGEYGDKIQRDIVFRQIGSAIENGKNIFTMPLSNTVAEKPKPMTKEELYATELKEMGKADIW